MKNKAGIAFIVTLICLTGFFFQKVHAQEKWNPAQTEILKIVNDYYAAFAKGDIKAYLAYIHPDFEGWNNKAPLPRKKEQIEKMANAFFQGNKVISFSLTPLSIKTYGTMAFMHYTFSIDIEGKDGKRSIMAGRSTDILVKQDSHWLIVGDHNEEK
ncbi:MAG: nuclear transport factor 2 family protein [Bacteroidota bacterium]